MRIKKSQLERLHAHASAGYPHEVVGILAGDLEASVIERVHPLTNERKDNSERRYVVNGLRVMEAEDELRAEGLKVLGYYHSHPDHAAMYSEYDREHALPNTLYLITSVRAGAAVESLCWRLQDDRTRMQAEPLQIED